MNYIKELIKKCIAMLEAYYEKARNLPNDSSKSLTLEGQDMTDWKKTYYPLLVVSGIIQDGMYFQNPLVNTNYGIGADGTCTKYEYIQFLWSAYKYLDIDFTANPCVKFIKQCIDMLDPYVIPFKNHLTETKTVNSLNANDSQRWMSDFYPSLMRSGLIADGQFFGDISKQPNYGIGKDGHFAGEELCHFLYQLYRIAYIIQDNKVPA